MDNKKIILIVDDESAIVEFLEMILLDFGYLVISAETGKKAIEILEEEKDKIEIILLDINLPDISGNILFWKFRDIFPEIKIIISSGDILNENIKKMLDYGETKYIGKPYGIEELKEILEWN